MQTRFKVVWRDRNGWLHATAPRFQCEESALRWAKILRRDAAVIETKVVAVQLQALPFP
jgi:hypothetical protein